MTLTSAGFKVAGAGATIDRARDPATLPLADNRRILAEDGRASVETLRLRVWDLAPDGTLAVHCRDASRD